MKVGGGHHGNFWLWEQVGWWEPILLGAQGRPGRPWPPRGSYPSPFSVAQQGKEALPNLASPVSPPPSGNVSPGPTQDSASRPHPRALHPSCESMHQLPGWQAPRREPQGISGLEEFSSREHYSQAAGDGVEMLNFRGRLPTRPHTPVREARGNVAGAPLGFQW